MTLQIFSDLALEDRLRQLVQNERELIHEVLLHIQEVDRRRLYLRRARPSLYDYLMKDMGLSPGSTQRRIDAARLAMEIPVLLEKIRHGKLFLCQIAILQKGIRQKSKEEKVSLETKIAILEKIQGATQRETEKIVVEALNLPALDKEKINVQSNKTILLELVLSFPIWEKLERCRELLAHQNPSGRLSNLLEELCDFFLERKDPGSKRFTSTVDASPQHEVGNLTDALRRFIFRRDKSCRYHDPITNRFCGSRYQLEIDHIKMRCHGGGNEPENLRAVCRPHNQQLAREQLGLH